MVFSKGRPPVCSFTLDDLPLELVNEFIYLGFTLTTQLSFTKHLETIVTKANSRCGILAAKLPLGDLPLDLVLQIYQCYVVPLFRYGMQIWLSSCSKAANKSANSNFTKYLKRYLGVPKYANNAITHYVTDTRPLLTQLNSFNHAGLGTFTFPPCLNGYQVSFLANLKQGEQYDPVKSVPTFFWRSRSYARLPTQFKNRQKLMFDIFDLEHDVFCVKDGFHVLDGRNCRCKACGQVMTNYHKYFCTEVVI